MRIGFQTQAMAVIIFDKEKHSWLIVEDKAKDLIGPREPQERPRWPQDAVRWPKMAPTWTHNGPKMALRRHKRAPRAPRFPKIAPTWSKELIELRAKALEN